MPVVDTFHFKVNYYTSSYVSENAFNETFLIDLKSLVTPAMLNTHHLPGRHLFGMNVYECVAVSIAY